MTAQPAGEDSTGRWTDYMPLALIRPALRNPKRHAAAEIRASITRFSLAELPLLDERTGRLVAGHGRLDDLAARKRAGEDPPGGVRVDPASGEWLVPVQRGWASRTDAEAEAYLAASNELSRRGGWDEDGLAEMLADIAATDPALLVPTGFTEEDMARMLGDDTPAGPPDTGPPDTADALAGTPDNYTEQYGVIVMCHDEAHQAQVYRQLKADGLNCKVVTT